MSLKDIERNLRRIEKQVRKESLEIFKEIAMDVSNESLTECPLDKGDLRESYRVNINYNDYLVGSKKGPVVVSSIDSFDQTNLAMRASYDTEYAILQHEELSFNHPTPGTKAKYLEDPMKRNRDKYMEMIKKGLKEGIR